jgi:hypothetical protein
MSIKITGVAEVKRQFAAIEAFLASTKPMEGIVADIKDIVLIKTASGVDYMGRGFKPYSKKYAEKKKGMTATGRPNLKLSGTMLGALKTEVKDARHGAVFVASVGEKGGANSDMLAQIHTTGTGKQPQREFMNLAPSAIKVLTKKHYGDPIGELAKAARGGTT